MDEEIEKGGKLKSKDIKVIRKKYSGSLTYSTLVRKEAFDFCVSQLSQINYVIYEYATITDEEKTFTPLSEYAKRMSHKVFFPKKSPFDNVKHVIGNMTGNLKRARVKGIDPNGHEAIYKLMNDYDAFEQYDYNDVIKTVNLNSKNLVESLDKSYLLDSMLEIARKPEIDAILSEKVK